LLRDIYTYLPMAPICTRIAILSFLVNTLTTGYITDSLYIFQLLISYSVFMCQQ